MSIVTIPPIGTKTSVPGLPDRWLTRPRLNDRCSRVGPREALLVAAFAGSGKSTLLADWFTNDCEIGNRAWLTLDARDNAPGRLSKLLACAPSGRGGCVRRSRRPPLLRHGGAGSHLRTAGIARRADRPRSRRRARAHLPPIDRGALAPAHAPSAHAVGVHGGARRPAAAPRPVARRRTAASDPDARPGAHARRDRPVVRTPRRARRGDRHRVAAHANRWMGQRAAPRRDRARRAGGSAATSSRTSYTPSR